MYETERSRMYFRNFWITPLTAFLSLIILSTCATAVPTVASEGKNLEYNEVVQGKSSSGTEGNWNVVMKMLDDCADKEFLSCVGVKVVTAIDRAAKMSDIRIIEGVTIVKTEDIDDEENGRAFMTEEELENSLDQEPSEKTSRLLEYLVDVASRFFRSHAIQFKLPELSSDRLQRALQEARGKKKIRKMLGPLMMGLGAKLLLTVPIGIAIVGFLAIKALIVSKLALLLAGFVAVQKLLGGGGLGSFGGGKNGWSSGVGSGWNTGGSGWSGAGTGGWSTSGSGASSGYYRSFDTNAPVDAHQLAYKAQAAHEISQ